MNRTRHSRAHAPEVAGVAADVEKREKGPRRILVISKQDGYANGVRPVEIERFLRKLGHHVRVVDTYHLSRASSRQRSLGNKLPGLGFRRLALYAIEAASRVFTLRWAFGRRHLSYYLLRADCSLRRSLLESLLPLDDFDLVICETPHDADVLTVAGSARTLYDCPTPWADELYFEDRLTERQHRELRLREAALFEGVDYLTFFWESYARYAVEHYGIDDRNLITLNFGCNVAADRVEFSDPPRIVYLGSLGGRFIDLPLLSRLTKLYPHIDVYGGPPPDPKLGLNYLGYAPPTVLQRYQLGLITCTQDELRSNGFSAKHPEYLAYGLPVLVPAWRRHLDLLKGSVPYEEQTFLDVIESLGTEDHWRQMSNEAYTQAQRLTWDVTLRPLAALVDDLG